MDQGRLHLRLFLEGIEVSVVEATVSAAAGSHAQANIQVIYTPEINYLLPRTLVHLFFFDSSMEASEGEPYRLLFCGDLTSITVTKTESNRAATLVCSDHKEYYNSAYVFLLNTANLKGANSPKALIQNRALFTQANRGAVLNEAGGLTSLISEIFDDPRPLYLGYNHLRGALGGVIKAMERFTGLTGSGSSGVNAFYAYNVARLNLLGQVGMYPNDFTSKKILNSEKMKALISQRGQQLGDLVSLNGLINFILGFIYHRAVPTPCPLYTSSSVDTDSSSITASSAKPIKASGKIIAEYLDHISPSTTDPPDLLYRAILDMYPHDAKTELEALKIDSTVYEAKSLFLTRISKPPVSVQEFKDYVSGVREEKDPESITQLMKRVAAQGDPTLTNATCRAIGALVAVTDALIPMRNEGNTLPIISGLISKASKEFANIVTDEGESSFTTDTSSRLYTSLIIPDLFFSVAPKCNVIFPDKYFTSAYARNMTREVSRLQLEVIDDLSKSNIASRYYYAPATTQILEGQGAALKSNEESILANELLAHETYTGIIPEFSSVTSLVLRSAFNSVDDSDFFSSIANYRFLQKRLAQRQLTISGTFNPYAAVGFPLVMIDVPDVEAKQYVGLLTSLTHSVSQQGGTTSYQVEYARPHTSDDDEYMKEFGSREITDTTKEQIELNTNDLLYQVVEKLKSGEDYSDELHLLKLILSQSKYVGGQGDFIRDGSLEAIAHTIPSKDEEGNVLQSPRIKVPLDEESKRIIAKKAGEGYTVSSTEVYVKDASPFGGNQYNVTKKNKQVLRVSFDQMVIVLRDNWASHKTVIMHTWITPTLEGYIVKIDQYKSQFGSRADAFVTALNTVGLAIFTYINKAYDLKDIPPDNVIVEVGDLIQDMGRNIKLTDDQFIAVLLGSHLTRSRCIFNMLSSITIEASAVKTSIMSYPVEEAMRPDFIHPAYSSPNIGKLVYKRLIGVDSIVDRDAGNEATFSIDLKLDPSEDPDKISGESQVLSQESAINLVVKDYIASDYAPSFIEEYTKRPIATLKEVLTLFHYKAYAETIDEDKEIPFLGHAFAISDESEIPDNMRRLSTEEQQQLKEEKVDDKVDVRVPRAERVRRYVKSLENRGLRG